MRRLCWVLKDNPVHADVNREDPELRFYAETIAAFLIHGSFDALDFVHLSSHPGQLNRLASDSDTLRVIKLIRDRAPNVGSINLLSVRESLDFRYELMVISSLVFKSRLETQQAADSCLEIARKADRVIYSDSSLELDESFASSRSRLTLLRFLRGNPDHPLIGRLSMVFTPEHYPGYYQQIKKGLGLPAALLPRLTFPVSPSHDVLRHSDRPYLLTFVRTVPEWLPYLKELARDVPDARLRFFPSRHTSSFRRDTKILTQAVKQSDTSMDLEIQKAEGWSAFEVRRFLSQDLFSFGSDHPSSQLTDRAFAALSSGCLLIMPYFYFDQGEEHHQFFFHSYLAKGGWYYDFGDRRGPSLGIRLQGFRDPDRWNYQKQIQLEFYNNYAGVEMNRSRVLSLLGS